MLPDVLTFFLFPAQPRGSTPDTSLLPAFPGSHQPPLLLSLLGITNVESCLVNRRGGRKRPFTHRMPPSLPRQEVINHIQAMRKTGAPYEAQKLYIFLERTDRLRDLRLQALTDRQKDLEEKRQKCLSSMVTMFPKVGLLPGDLLRGQHSQ